MMSDSDSDNTIDLTPIKDLIIQSGVATSEGTDHNIMAVFLAAGVEKIEDLKYLEEKDLETVLPLVKRKKMISHIQMVLEGTSVPLMEHDDSINTSRSSSSSLIEESDEDVMKNKDAAIAAYTFPHQQIPVKMKKWLGTKRPTPAEKAHFVRIVTDDIMVYNCRPSRDNLRPIAKKLVTMFPSSLQTIGVCGAPSLADDTAHYSLLRQMEQRVINQRRSIDSLSKESQGKRKHDHGCKQFNPTSDKTSEELEEIRLDMVTMYQEQQPLDNDEVFHKMSDVFSYLRGVINSGKNGISDLKRDWPLLFTFCGLSSHYDMLVDGSTIETFKGNYLGRMAELACYMQSLQSKNAGIQKVCMQVAEAKQATRSNQPEVFGLLLMIIKYFKEDESCMFRKDENDAIPATPCILTGGQPLLVSTAYKICLDRKVIFQQIGTPEDALAIFFSTFYVFNVEYPEGLAVSMHFLESQIAGINYRSGTKKTKGRYKAKIDGIPVRILALLDGFALFKNSI